MKVKEFENTCIYCGEVIPEGRTVCPKCACSEAEHFEKAMSRKLPQISHTEFKVNDAAEQAFRQGYTTGFNEGMKAACEIKQENERLKRENAFLRGQLEVRSRVDDMDGEYE